jgi:hypothetical protein
MFCAITLPVDDATTDFGDSCDDPSDCTNLSRATFGGAGVAEADQPDAETSTMAAMTLAMTEVFRRIIGSD